MISIDKIKFWFKIAMVGLALFFAGMIFHKCRGNIHEYVSDGINYRVDTIQGNVKLLEGQIQYIKKLEAERISKIIELDSLLKLNRAKTKSDVKKTQTIPVSVLRSYVDSLERAEGIR